MRIKTGKDTKRQLPRSTMIVRNLDAMNEEDFRDLILWMVSNAMHLFTRRDGYANNVSWRFYAPEEGEE